MFLAIIRYIKGYIRIRVVGYSAERFLNACSHRGILLWGLRFTDGAYEMNITIKGFRQLKPIIRKTGTKVAIVERFGLPFLLHKYRKRKLFFGGAVLCIIILFLLSRNIWNIDISGNLTYTDETLVEFLESKNITNGMPKSKVDCSRIVKDIRKEYNDIIWVSASVRGTRLMIQIKENEDSPAVAGRTGEEKDSAEGTAEESAPTDLVADRDCLITKLVPRNGVPAVQPGTEVKKGDLLVSGQIPVMNDAGEVTAYQYHESDADIWGKVTLEYQEKMPIYYEEKDYEHYNLKKQEGFIKIGTRYIRIGSIKNQYENWELRTVEHQVRIGKNFYLPLAYGCRTAVPYLSEKKEYPKKELQQILSTQFNRYCDELKKKGVEIIENNVKIYTGSKEARAEGNLTVIMPVGVSKPSERLEVPIQEDQEESGE